MRLRPPNPVGLQKLEPYSGSWAFPMIHSLDSPLCEMYSVSCHQLRTSMFQGPLTSAACKISSPWKGRASHRHRRAPVPPSFLLAGRLRSKDTLLLWVSALLSRQHLGVSGQHSRSHPDFLSGPNIQSSICPQLLSRSPVTSVLLYNQGCFNFLKKDLFLTGGGGTCL